MPNMSEIHTTNQLKRGRYYTKEDVDKNFERLKNVRFIDDHQPNFFQRFVIWFKFIF